MTELIGHATYLLLAASYMVRDMVWLRAISIPASVCSIIFSYYGPAEPLWLVINWNLVFLTVNLIQLGLILYDYRLLRCHDETGLFELLSPILAVRHIARLQKLGNHETVQGPACLIEEGNAAKQLFFVVSGDVEISKKGMKIGQCGASKFVGEISFLSGAAHSASVTVPEGQAAQLYRWDHKSLKSYASSHPEFHVALQRLLANNMSGTLLKSEHVRSADPVNKGESPELQSIG